jgi:hypothetical protein
VNFGSCRMLIRVHALKNTWVPDASFKFPTSGKRNLKFQHSWFHRFCWLAYSKEQHGAFCKYCVLFVPKAGVGTNHQRPGRLVISKYDKRKDALADFGVHQATDYHTDCMRAAENLLKVTRGEIPSVDVVLNSQLKQQIEENRKRIIPIIDTIILWTS